MNYKQKILESENISKRISITTIESILSETNTKEEAVITIINCLKEILPTIDIKEYKEINQDLIKLIDYEESKPKKSKK
jgi:hypothetical protein